MSRRMGRWGLVLLAASCQSYEAEPLDAEGHLARWEGRLQRAEQASREAARDLAAPGFDVSDGVDLEEALAVASLCNSSLRSARVELAVEAERREEAERWADPQVGLELLRAIQAASRPWLVTGSIAMQLPTPGVREARRMVADAGLRRALAELSVREQQILEGLEQRWLDWSHARAEVAILEEHAADLKSLRDDVARLEAAGSIPDHEGRRLAIEAARLEGRRRQQEAEAELLRLEIVGLMGLRPDAPWELRPRRAGREVAVPDSETERIIEVDPLVALQRAEYDVAEARLQQAHADQWPGLSLGPALEAEDGDAKVGVTGEASLPLWNRNRGGIAIAWAQRDVARAHFEARLEERIAVHVQVERRLQNAEAHLDYLQNEVAPLAAEQWNQVRRLAELGELDSTLLLEAWRTVLELRVERLRAEAARERVRSQRAWMLAPWSLRPTTAEEGAMEEGVMEEEGDDIGAAEPSAADEGSTEAREDEGPTEVREDEA